MAAVGGYEIANAYIALTVKAPGIKGAVASQLGGVESEAKAVGGRAGAGLAGAMAGAVAAATQVALRGITSAIGDAVSRTDALKSFPLVMKNLGYSGEEAARSINKISDNLIGLPTSLDSLVGFTKRIAPVTRGLMEAADLSLAFNNALLAGGVSVDLQAEAMEQYAQILSVGKVDMMAWRSITRAMPAQLDQLSRSMLGAGANSMTLYGALQDGSVSMDQLNEKIIELNTTGIDGLESFETQARAATGGIGTSFENLKISVVRGLANILDALNVSNFANWAAGVNDSLFGAFSGVAEKLSPVLDQIGESASRGLQPFIDGLVSFISDPERVERFGTVLTALFDSLGGVGEILAPVAVFLGDIASILLDTLAQVLPELVPLFVQLGSSIALGLSEILPLLVPLIRQVADVFARMVVEILPQLIPLIPSIVEGFVELLNAIIPILPELTELALVLIPVAIASLPLFVELLRLSAHVIKDILVPAVSILTDLLGGLLDFVTNVFEGDWGGAWDSIRDGFGEAWNSMRDLGMGVINTLIGAVNLLIGAWNGLIGMFNSDLKVPEIDRIEKEGTGRGRDLPGGGAVPYTGNVPQFASGGIVRATPGGTVGLLAEAGRDEAVLPLPRDWRENGIGGGSTGTPVTVNATFQEMDPNAAIRQMSSQIAFAVNGGR